MWIYRHVFFFIDDNKVLFVVGDDLLRVGAVVETPEKLVVLFMPLFWVVVTCFSGPIGVFVDIKVVFNDLNNFINLITSI